MNSKTIVTTLKGLNVHRLLRPIKPLLPNSLISWVQKNTVYKLVLTEELKPEYKRACKYLSETAGIENIGDYLEFGVSGGTSLNCMHEVLQELRYSSVRLFGFDSFEGLPAYASNEDDGVWEPGQFKSEYHVTHRFLDKKGVDWQRTFLIKGWFSDTLNQELISKHQIDKASLIMIDCDIYSASKEALSFCAPLIKDISIIFFDDWGTFKSDEKNVGEKRAFDEFLQEHTHLKARSFGGYNWYGRPYGKIFLVSNELFLGNSSLKELLTEFELYQPLAGD